MSKFNDYGEIEEDTTLDAPTRTRSTSSLRFNEFGEIEGDTILDAPSRTRSSNLSASSSHNVDFSNQNSQENASTFSNDNRYSMIILAASLLAGYLVYEAGIVDFSHILLYSTIGVIGTRILTK
jgi:hypothetical protein